MQISEHSRLDAKCNNRISRYTLALWIYLAPSLAIAQSEMGYRVIDESAIPYMEFLPKADFDQRFPGQIKSNLAELDNGWYVIYAHEQLNYYFGPILLESIGQDYLMQLTQIVEAAVGQRPGIQGYQLALTYEPSTAFSGPGGSSDKDSDSGSSSVGSEQQPKESSESQSTGFWGFIRRVFGL